jgi:hypothetical protein
MLMYSEESLETVTMRYFFGSSLSLRDYRLEVDQSVQI